MSCSQNNRISHQDFPRSCCQVPQPYHSCYPPVHQVQPQCYQHPIQKSCCQIQNSQSFKCQTNFHQNQSCMSYQNQPNPCSQAPTHHENKSFICQSSYNNNQEALLHKKESISQTTPKPTSHINEDKQSPIQKNVQNISDINQVEKRILELEKNRYKIEKELLKSELRRRDEQRKYRKMLAISNENKHQEEQTENHDNRVHQLRQSHQFLEKEILLNEQKNSKGNSFDGQTLIKTQQTPAGYNPMYLNDQSANNFIQDQTFVPQNLFNQNLVQKDKYYIDQSYQNIGWYQNNEAQLYQNQVNDAYERQNQSQYVNNYAFQNQRFSQYSNTKKQQYDELPPFSSNQFMTVNQSLYDDNIQQNQYYQRNSEPIGISIIQNIPGQIRNSQIFYENQDRQVIVDPSYQNSQNNSNFKIPQQNSINNQNEAQIPQNLKKQKEIYYQSLAAQNKEIQFSSVYSIKSSITDQESANDYQKHAEAFKNIQPFSYQEKVRVKRGSQSPQKNNQFNYKNTKFYNNQFGYQQPNFQNHNIQQINPMIEDQDSQKKQIYFQNQAQEQNNQYFDQQYQMNIIENSRLASGKNVEKNSFTSANQYSNIMQHPHQNLNQNSYVLEMKEKSTPQIDQQQFLEFNQNKIYQSFDNVVPSQIGFSKPIVSLSNQKVQNEQYGRINQNMYETGSQLFNQSKDQGYILQNRPPFSQQIIDFNMLKYQNQQNQNDIQYKPLQGLSESLYQQQNCFNKGNESQDFCKKNDSQNFFENNETFNGSKQIIPVYNFQNQNLESINIQQKLQESINQREPFERNNKVLNISHVNSIQIIPETNRLQKIQENEAIERHSGNKIQEQNVTTQNSIEVESDNIKLPKFKMKELRSRSKEMQLQQSTNENQSKKSISRERFRDNECKPLKVLSVKLVNEKNKSHRGRHQKNQKQSSKSKNRFNLISTENQNLVKRNYNQESIQIAETPIVNMQKNILSQSSENIYLLKLNQNENVFQQSNQFDKMIKNEKNSNKENEKINVNLIEQSQLNTMTEAEEPPKLQLHNQKMNSVTDIQKIQSQQLFQKLPLKSNDSQNFNLNIPKNTINCKIQQKSGDLASDLNENVHQIEKFQYFGNYQSANLPNKKRNILLNHSSESSNRQSKQACQFENKLSCSEEIPLRERSKHEEIHIKDDGIDLNQQIQSILCFQKDESNLEINKIIIQSLQKLENQMKLISQQEKKSVKQKELSISREVVIEIPAEDSKSIKQSNISVVNSFDLRNQDFIQIENQQLENIQNKSEASNQNFNQNIKSTQNIQLYNQNSQKSENFYNNNESKAILNGREHQLLKNFSCKSTYTNDQLKNNIQQNAEHTIQSNQKSLTYQRSEVGINEQDKIQDNLNFQNCNQDHQLNDTLKNSNFTQMICENPQFQEANEQNKEIEGLLNYVFQPQQQSSDERVQLSNHRQSFGGTNKKHESSSQKEDRQERTVTLSEVIDCNIEQVNYDNPIQKDFNPFSSNYDHFSSQNSQIVAKNNQQAQKQKKQDYVILSQMQNSIKIVKLKTDPSLQSNLLIKKSFDDSQHIQNISSSNQKSQNLSYNECVNLDAQDQQQQEEIKPFQSNQVQISKDLEKSRLENNLMQNSQSSQQQRQLLQLDGNHNYHRTEHRDNQIVNQKYQKCKDDNIRYQQENESEFMNSRKSNSQSRRSQSRKSKKQSNNGTLQSDYNANQTLQLDKNKINNNLMKQINNLQSNFPLPNRIDQERQQFYRDHFQQKRTISQNSSEKLQQQSPIQVDTNLQMQNVKRSPKTELIRGFSKRMAQKEESQNGLIELEKSSLYPNSLYDSTQREQNQNETQKFVIEKRLQDNSGITVGTSVSQPFKKKKRTAQFSYQESGFDQQDGLVYAQQYPINHTYAEQMQQTSNQKMKLTTPKRSPDINNHRIEWQDTLMKVPQNQSNEFNYPIQKANGSAISDNYYFAHQFIPQSYTQPIIFAPVHHPYSQMQQPYYLGYENKIQNINAPFVVRSQSQSNQNQGSNKQINQVEANNIKQRQSELSSSQKNKPFRSVLNMQQQKLQQSYQILQNEFEKKRQQEQLQSQTFNQAQRKLSFKDNEETYKEFKQTDTIQNKAASSQSPIQSQSLNLSDGQDFHEVVPVQRNYRSINSKEQHNGQSQTISSYKRKSTKQSQDNIQSIQNQLSNSSLMHNTNNPGFQKDLFNERLNSRSNLDSNQQHEHSGIQSHQTSQGIIKQVSLKGHILAGKSPKFCNSITFDNQLHQFSSQIDSQQIHIASVNNHSKQEQLNLSLQQNQIDNTVQLRDDDQNHQNHFNRNYYEVQKQQQEQRSLQTSVIISQLQSLQIQNQSSVTSPNSNTLTPTTILNNMKNIINKENQFVNNSQKDTVYSDMYKQHSSKKQNSQLTNKQEQTPSKLQSQYVGDSKSATVDQKDPQIIHQQSSILIKRLSSFKSDYSENKPVQLISRDSNISNQVKNAQRISSQREASAQSGNQQSSEIKSFLRLKSQVRGSSFEPLSFKNISKDFKKECENLQDCELTPITNNLSNDNYFKMKIDHSEQMEENEKHSKSVVQDECREMILEFKRAKNNNVILNMERNIKQLQEKIQNKIERQGSKNSQSTYNLPPRTSFNKIQNDFQIYQSENVLRPVENKIFQKAPDTFKFQINEKKLQKTSQTTLNTLRKNQNLGSNLSSQKDIKIFKQQEIIEKVHSIGQQNSEKSFQKLSELPSSNSMKHINNPSIDHPLYSKRLLPREFKSIYSHKEDKNEIYGYYKSSSNLQNSESFNEEAENQISRSLIEVQVKEFLQQPNILSKLKNASNLDDNQHCSQNLNTIKINIDSASNTGPVYSQSGYEQCIGGFLMHTGEAFDDSFRESKSRVSMGKLLESNKSIIREMREQNSKESSRQFLKSEHFQ